MVLYTYKYWCYTDGTGITVEEWIVRNIPNRIFGVTQESTIIVGIIAKLADNISHSIFCSTDDCETLKAIVGSY